MKQLFSFKGRASRSKLLISLVASELLYLLVMFIPVKSGIVFTSVFLIMAVIAVSYVSYIIRRFHDLGRPGSHFFSLFIPFYNFYIIYLLFFVKGMNGANEFGEDPVVVK